MSVSVSTSASQPQADPPLSHLSISLSAQDVVSPTVYGSPPVPAPARSSPPLAVTLSSSLPITPSTSEKVEAMVRESAALSPVMEMLEPARNWMVSVLESATGSVPDGASKVANKFCNSLVADASASSSTLSVAQTKAVPFHCSLSVPLQVGELIENSVETKLSPLPAV